MEHISRVAAARLRYTGLLLEPRNSDQVLIHLGLSAQPLKSWLTSHVTLTKLLSHPIDEISSQIARLPRDA